MFVGFALEFCETATFFVKRGGALAEFGVGLVDKRLFCLELGFKGGFGFGKEGGYRF